MWTMISLSDFKCSYHDIEIIMQVRMARIQTLSDFQTVMSAMNMFNAEIV